MVKYECNVKDFRPEELEVLVQNKNLVVCTYLPNLNLLVNLIRGFVVDSILSTDNDL